MTTSNKITLLRVSFGPLFLWSFISGKKYLSIIFLFLNLFGDIFDGYLARKRGEVTKLGEMIDPIIDSLFFLFVALSFSLEGIEGIGWFFIPLALIGFSFILPYFRDRKFKIFHTKTKYLHTPLIYVLVLLITINFCWQVLFWITFIFLSLTSLELFIRSIRYSINLKF